MKDLKRIVVLALACMPLATSAAVGGARVVGPIEQQLIDAKSSELSPIAPGVYRVQLPNGRVGTYWFGSEGASWMLARKDLPGGLAGVLEQQVVAAGEAKAEIVRSACQGAFTLRMKGGIVYSTPGYHYTEALTSVTRNLGGPQPPNFPITTYAYAALANQAPPNGSENQTWSYGSANGGPVVAEVQATCPTPGACSTAWVTTNAFSIEGCENGGIEWQGAN